MNRHVKVYRGDSRVFLNKHLENAHFHDAVVFFYLDAHWYDDLPLREECEIILGKGVRAVIMIDDFEVPGDLGYGYDSYSTQKTLSLKYLRAIDHDYYYAVFFPNCRSEQETGAKRGCAVISTCPRLTAILRDTQTLVEFKDVSSLCF